MQSRHHSVVFYIGLSIALLSLSISAQDQSGFIDCLAGEGDASFLVPSASALPGEAEANTVRPVPGTDVDYTSIQEAIDGSEPGDIIYVQSGTYSENVEVNKTAVVLKGVDTGGGKPVVAGDGIGSTITLSADGCTLEGFVVMNSGNPHAGIDVKSNGNIIVSNTIRENRGYGISVSNSSENAFEWNVVSNNGFDGIFLEVSHRNEIIGNTVNSNKMNGVRLIDSDENTIMSNAIANNGLYGAFLERSNYNVITVNTILHSLKGGIHLVDSMDNIITRNNYEDIFFENSEGNTIEDNNYVERYGDDESNPSEEEGEEGGEDEEGGEGRPTHQLEDGETIQDAINNFAPEYIIEVPSGTYNENVNVDKPGTVLQGVDTVDGYPVIYGDGVGDALTMSGGGSTADGFVVENSGNPHAGICVTSDGNVISNVEVTGNKGYGIYVTANGNRIENCSVAGNGNDNGFDAILLEGSSGNTISGCTIVGGDNLICGAGAGINLVDSELNVVSDNDIHGGSEESGCGGGPGILLKSSDNNRISDNDAIAGGLGLPSRGDGIWLSSSSDNVISANSAITGGNGINLSSSNGNEISGNSVINGGDVVGINLDGSTGNVISGNSEIYGLVDGINLIDSAGNEISGNSAITGGDGSGIILYGSSKNDIVENKAITGAACGINLNAIGYMATTSSGNNVIKGNIITKSGCGVGVYKSDDNKIYLNKFEENEKNAQSDIFSSNSWNSPDEMPYQYKGEEYTNFLGNYWHDYVEKGGYDRNGDGIGDVPYHISPSGVGIYPDSSEKDEYPIFDPEILETVGLIDPLFVEKTASVSEVERGEAITYTIRLYNNGDLPATDVVVKDVFNKDVEFTSVSPSPDPDGLWRFDEIDQSESVTITLVVKVPRQDLEYKSASIVNGVGFVNVEDVFKTSFEPYVLRNEVFVTFYNQTLGANDSASDVEDVSVLAGRGTELRSVEHGSGRYESDEAVSVLTENRSISMDKEVFARYEPVTLGLYRNRTVTYSSRWTEEVQAKNWVTGASMSESYRYVTSIGRESRVFLDKNESMMDIESEFDGTGHFSLFKTENPETSVKSPDFEFLEDYTGSFRVYERLDQYGSSVTSEKSASGEGLVSTDKRLGDSQRSHESGSGTYESEEVIATSTSYIAKDLSIVSGPTSTGLTDDLFVNLSMRWREGIWSKVENRSLISENYASLDRLDKETVARGLNTMETEANFSGRASYRTILDGQADFDDEYEGDYSLERKVLFRGVSKYDLPHLNVMKVERIVSIPSKNEVFANYMIIVENDGNQDLSPVYVKDLFSPGAEFVNSSMRPTLGSGSATWTLTHIAAGDRSEIDLWLNVTGCNGDLLVNRVEATGLYDDQSVSASNSSSSEIGWLQCCEPDSSVAVTKTAYVSSKNPNKIWYLVEVHNRGDSTKVAKVVDTFPEGMTLVEASPAFSSSDEGEVSWNLIDLGPGEARIITYGVEVLWSGTFSNSISVSVESVDGEVEAPTGTTSAITVAEFAGEHPKPGWTEPEWDFEYASQTDISP